MTTLLICPIGLQWNNPPSLDTDKDQIMIRKIGSAILIGIVVFAIYKWFGGDIAAFFSTVADLFFQIIDKGSDVVIEFFTNATD